MTPCQLPAANPRRNGELNDQLDATEAAWAACAAQVDAVYQCQQEQADEQAQPGA